MPTFNRSFSGGGSRAVVTDLEVDPSDSTVSVVLLTNFPEVQASAMEAGASASFGKRVLQSDEVHQTLNTMLS